MARLILASTSAHRRRLLERLRLPFDVADPAVDETEHDGEQPKQLAIRLANAKARAIRRPDAVVVGADQVASLDGRILRKPGSADGAVRQLLRCQGRTIDFFTAAAVIDHGSDRQFSTIDCTTVRFRTLDRAALARYVELDESWDCAGGFKAESLGCILFERITTEDPTGLIGLPMIWLAGVLIECGLNPLSPR